MDLDSVAHQIERWGLSAPALLFLEAHRPLAWLGGQALLLLQPVLMPFCREESIPGLVALLSDEANLNRLMRRLEAGPGSEGKGIEAGG
ncbi:MAG: hypothetical protein HY871_03545 [Chloroflexi bacterium]|nr:hypothetical protein [Chloroflexota bacterium]